MPPAEDRKTGHPATAPRVLVVDDDPGIGDLVGRYLRGQGLPVDVVRDAMQLRTAMQSPAFDVVLLDLGLPDEDGLALMRELRACWSGPVIIVSGRGEPVERVVGLELGADDYLAKPFDLRELLARIRSVWRRARAQVTADNGDTGRLVFDGLMLDLDTRHLLGRDGEVVPLTSGEFALLRVLLAHPHHVLTRDQLMSGLHGRDAGPFNHAIDMQIGRLRRKVEPDPHHPRLILAVRGAGYLLAARVQQVAD